MRIYRISKTQYINDLSGEGARLYGGRWNKKGDSLLYFSQNLSLSLLEIIVHVEYAKLPMDYSYVEAEIPDSCIKKIQSIDFIQPNWSSDGAVNETQMVGSNWINTKEGLAMSVPSVILSQEHTILINPKHEDFEKLKILGIHQLDIDPRLFR